MLTIGCDSHTRYQQIAMAEDSTGELLAERRLDHESGEAEAFYRSLPGAVRVGIVAAGPIHWFVRLLAELGHDTPAETLPSPRRVPPSSRRTTFANASLPAAPP